MALKNNFYDEIFEEEKKWIDLINSNLLNSIYFKHELKPFYLKKMSELINEYSSTKSNVIKMFIELINNILTEIDLLIQKHENNQKVDCSSLIPLFLKNQMGSSYEQKETKDSSIDYGLNLQIKKQLLQNDIDNIRREKPVIDDYLYDDFPEEKVRAK